MTGSKVLRIDIVVKGSSPLLGGGGATGLAVGSGGHGGIGGRAQAVGARVGLGHHNRLAGVEGVEQCTLNHVRLLRACVVDGLRRIPRKKIRLAKLEFLKK